MLKQANSNQCCRRQQALNSKLKDSSYDMWKKNYLVNFKIAELQNFQVQFFLEV